MSGINITCAKQQAATQVPSTTRVGKQWKCLGPSGLYNLLVVRLNRNTLECGKLLSTFHLRSIHRKVCVDTQGNDLGRNNGEIGTIRCDFPKGATASLWEPFREQKGVGLRELATPREGLRCAPPAPEKERTRPGVVSR